MFLPGDTMRMPGNFQILMPRTLGRSLACIMIAPFFICGCSHFREEVKAKSGFEEANDFFNQGKYNASLSKYEQIVQKYPSTKDRVLFEMGFIYAHPKNEQKDYQKARECFQKIIKDHPESGYRQDSEMMIFNIDTVIGKDLLIAAQQKEIQALLHETKVKENEITALQRKIQSLEEKVSALALQNASVDKVLIEKERRRLMLISKGEVLKTYKIALGGNPNGPKERQGDNKTPEGTYVIDSRNKDSRYHLALRISYPNERDKNRAKDLGVSPGGNIMIHGIKNGFSWVGDLHTGIDWTQGCIAVTDEEIEQISKLVPNGTTVEIRP